MADNRAAYVADDRAAYMADNVAVYNYNIVDNIAACMADNVAAYNYSRQYSTPYSTTCAEKNTFGACWQQQAYTVLYC